MAAIIVHGGCGKISNSKRTPIIEGCKRAAIVGHKVLESGGSSLDAVEAAVRVLEDDYHFNAGHGAVLNSNGDIEMDAMIMEGKNLQLGSVGGIKGVANPVSLARLVMEKTDHVMLIGEGAKEFARERGIPDVSTEELMSPRKAKKHKLKKPQHYKDTDHTHPLQDTDHTHPTQDRDIDTDHTHPPQDTDHTHPPQHTDHTHPPQHTDHTHPPQHTDHTHPPQHTDHTHPPQHTDHTHPPQHTDHTHPPQHTDHTHPPQHTDHTHPTQDTDHTHPTQDTVGAVARDIHGNIACATSTGGISLKRPGRIGDSPIIGCGGFADDNLGGVSATGHGESITRVTLAHRVLSLLATHSVDESIDQALRYMWDRTGGKGGLILITKDGAIGKGFTTLHMSWTSIDPSGHIETGVDNPRVNII